LSHPETANSITNIRRVKKIKKRKKKKKRKPASEPVFAGMQNH